MKTYILRRLLLMPFTLLGVTFIVFCITRFVPGGPVEQMMQQQAMSALSGKKAGGQQSNTSISEADMEKLEEQSCPGKLRLPRKTSFPIPHRQMILRIQLTEAAPACIRASSSLKREKKSSSLARLPTVKPSKMPSLPETMLAKQPTKAGTSSWNPPGTAPNAGRNA